MPVWRGGAGQGRTRSRTSAIARPPGDAVNVASRLETAAPAGRIQVSAAVAEALDDAFELESRGSIELKGKGSTEVFLLIGRRG